MKIKFTLLSVFLMAVFCHTGLNGQNVVFEFSERPQTINVCGADSLSFFRIEITNQINFDEVRVQLPKGVSYVPGSIVITDQMGFILEESDISDLNSPVFSPDINAVGSGDYVEFTISKSAECDAIEFAASGEVAQDTIILTSDASNLDTAITSGYNINYASISTSYVSETARDTVVNDLPSRVCRSIEVVNGGTGYLTRFQHQVVPGADLQDYALVFQGDTLVPMTTSGDTLFYEFDLTEAPFIGNFGDGNSLFENGEFIRLEECFTVNSCDFTNGTVRHQSYWGCGGDVCQFGNEINGNVNLQFKQPNLRSSIDFRDNIVCMDGVDRGVIRMKVWNDGQGPAVLNRISARANGANTAIDTTNLSITYNGTDIKTYFPEIIPVINPGLACGENVTRMDLESSDFLSSFQLLPGDTVYVEMQYVLCCPTTCGDYSRSNPSIGLRGTDLCGNNNQSATETSGTGGSASVADPIVSGSSILSNGQTETYCVEYPNYQFLPVVPSDSSYVTFVVGMPDGLEYVSSTSTVSYAGTAIPIALEEVTPMGDSLLLHMLLSDMPAQANAPLKVCFDLVAVCPDIGGLTSLTLGQSTSINCDPLCMIRLNCSSHDILVFGCGIGPGDCEEGGGNIFSYDVQRISFGYEDPEDDRDWTSFVRADSADVNIKRAMVGDTIRHRSKLGFTSGTNTSWDQATYQETYTQNWQNMLCPDTAWVVIRNGGTTYTAGGLTPNSIQNGFEYDLSVSNLSNLGDLPANYEFSSADTLYLNTQYAFCKENAPDWFSVEPGVYQAANDRQNVVFTGSFEASAVNDPTSYGCGDSAYDEMMFLGAALSVEIKSGGFAGSGCDRNFRYLFEIRQNIGGVLSGFTGTYDFFPNEFRPLYIPDSIVVAKQPDVFYDTARLVTRQINNATQEVLDKYIPLSSQTANTLVFKVRDVHDAFGGMLFPYEEENADLRYYIEFRRSCASPQAMQTDLEIAYTTPLCPGDEFQTVQNNLSTGNNSNLYNIDYTQTPKAKPANNNSTCFELEVRPRAGLLSYSWIEFPANTDVTILSVSENGAAITPDAEGRYRLGAHAGNTTKTFTICADLNTCSQTDFDVLFGWDCNGYPDEVSYVGTCNYDVITYTIETVSSQLQLNLTNQPGRDPMTGNYPELCAPLIYELFVNSANAGSVSEPQMDITLPVGFTIDSIEAEYPNGSNRELMPYSVNGNVISVNLYEHSELVNDSLPGTATDIIPANRQIFVRLHGSTSCDFRSGSRLFFTLFGTRPCGGPVNGNGVVVGSDRLRIDGLAPYEVNPMINIDVSGGVTCSFGTPVNVSYVVEGGDFIGTDSSVITLSPGLDFVPGSFICTSSTSTSCPEIDRIEPNPSQPGGSLIFLRYNTTVAEGDTVKYNFEVKAQSGTSCGLATSIGIENYITVSDLECNGMVCPGNVVGVTGAETVDIVISHTDLAFVEFMGNTIDGTPYVDYSGSLTISEEDLATEDSLYIKTFCADMNGMPVGVAVDSVLISGPIAIGSTVSFSGQFLQNLCDLDNGLVVTTEPIRGCLCTEPRLYQPDIGNEERTFDLALVKTINQPVNMAYGDTLEFEIQIFNQGDVRADSFEITDYIPSGLSYVTDNDADGWVYDGAGKAKRWVAGPLAGGADTTISISLKLEYTFEVGAYINVAEISQDANPFDLDDIDSTPDDNPDNDAGGQPDSPADDYVDGDGTGTPGDGVAETDEDDHDPARVTIADLALRKVMSDDTPGPYKYGDTLRMNIELYNQGNVPTNYIEVTDYLPAGLTYIDDATLNAGWDGSDPSNPVYTWTNDTLFQTESDTISIYVVLDMVDMPDSSSWTNFSEISVSRDTLGMDLDDIDSQADNDPTNDAGGQPESPADDHIDGDGTGTPGDGVAETDEDDHDPLHVDVFDLALAKTFDQPIDMVYGDTLVFDIQVFNQGNVVADRFEITDYIPSGLIYVTENDADGWVYDGSSKAKRWVEGPLESGADTTISISLILKYTYEVGAYINISEISQHENPKDLDDIDSTPDDDPDNDAGGQPDSPADDYVDGDGTGTPGDGVAETDEDDHDPARVRIADLALRKVMSDDTPGPYRYGDTLRMNIELYNQGNVPTNYIEVTDYLPAGFTYIDDATLNAGWDGSDPSNPVYTWTNDTLYQAESDTISIYVVLNMVDMPDSSSWTNFSEISVSRDTLGMDLNDIDSQADNDPTNDAGGQPESPADDHIEGDGTGTPGDGVAETDEDDHDPLRVAVYDLALTKMINPSNPGPYRYGDTIILDITVYNQGNEPRNQLRLQITCRME